MKWRTKRKLRKWYRDNGNMLLAMLTALLSLLTVLMLTKRRK